MQEVARRLADEIDSLLNASGNVEKQHEIERLVGGYNFGHFSFDAIFIDGEIRFLHAANCSSVAICDAGIEAQQLRRQRTHKLPRRCSLYQGWLFFERWERFRIIAKHPWR